MYYIISFMYNCKEHYCIWYTDDEDYVLTNGNQLMFFIDINNLMVYAEKHSIVFEKESAIRYDIDEMNTWCKNSNDYTVNCNCIIEFWNICTDVAKGLKVDFEGMQKEYDVLYEKLFLGNNITNTSSEKYTPIFSNIEVQTIKYIIGCGINIIIKNL